MNYRHAYHAGNFADVVKHLALTAILQHLRKKETPFAVIDSHAGRGLYDLASPEAQKTGEAAGGIERLRGLAAEGALGQYLALVNENPGEYPGSPLIAARMLRPQDRLSVIEKHPEEAAALKVVLAPYRKARVEEGDGYARLMALLPPPERRGLVLMDPPFEAEDEFITLARHVIAAHRRFATGIYLVWFPVKSQSTARAFTGEVLNSGVRKALMISIRVEAPEPRLAEAALLVLNPPFDLDAEMQAVFNVVAPKLEASCKLEWLAAD